MALGQGCVCFRRPFDSRPEAALPAPFSPHDHRHHHRHQGSTRILLTHQRQFLPRCDRVLVLRAGHIQALGTWEEVAGLNLPELTAGALGTCGAAYRHACGTGSEQWHYFRVSMDDAGQALTYLSVSLGSVVRCGCIRCGWVALGGGRWLRG